MTAPARPRYAPPASEKPIMPARHICIVSLGGLAMWGAGFLACLAVARW